jgi:hypothetical protein
MRQLLEDEERSVADSEVTPPQEEEVNLSFSADSHSPASFDNVTPAPVQVFKLWQVFIERVNPLTKLIHVPTLQPLVFEASTDHSKIPHNAQALLYAIYFVSTVALTEVEAIQILNLPREDALKRFASGVKIALTRANFLERYDMLTLQALVLYLVRYQNLIQQSSKNNQKLMKEPARHPFASQPSRDVDPQWHPHQNGPKAWPASRRRDAQLHPL